MLIYAFLYISVMKIMKRTGRITPIWGFIAIVVDFLISNMAMAFLYSTGKYHIINDGYIDKTEKILLVYSSILSFILTIFTFYFLSKLLKKKNWRNELKHTKINYEYVGFAITLLSIYLMIDIYQFSDKSGAFLFGELATQSLLTIVSVTYCFRYHKLVTQAKEEVGKNQEVLLLRSFKQAKKPSRNLSQNIINKIGNYNFLEHIIFGYTFDQVITVYLNDSIGYTIALGDPNDYLPEDGAFKIYVPDKDLNNKTWWDDAVELINKVKLNIVFESEGEGTKRELEYIRNNLSSKRIILITYPLSYNINIWDEFYTICKQVEVNIPRKFPGYGVVISFDSNWNYILSSEFDHNLEKMVEYIKKSNEGFE